jgi:hypothetical protein
MRRCRDLTVKVLVKNRNILRSGQSPRLEGRTIMQQPASEERSPPSCVLRDGRSRGLLRMRRCRDLTVKVLVKKGISSS